MKHAFNKDPAVRTGAAILAGALASLGLGACSEAPDNPCAVSVETTAFTDAPYQVEGIPHVGGKEGSKKLWLSLSHPLAMEMASDTRTPAEKLALIVFGESSFFGEKSRTLLSLTDGSRAQVNYDGLVLNVQYQGDKVTTSCAEGKIVAAP